MGGSLPPFDPAEGLTTDAAVVAFMEEAFKTEDAGYIAHALGVVARAKGDRQGNGAVARAALSVVQRERKSDVEDHAGGDEGAGGEPDGGAGQEPKWG